MDFKAPKLCKAWRPRILSVGQGRNHFSSPRCGKRKQKNSDLKDGVTTNLLLIVWQFLIPKIRWSMIWTGRETPIVGFKITKCAVGIFLYVDKHQPSDSKLLNARSGYSLQIKAMLRIISNPHDNIFPYQTYRNFKATKSVESRTLYSSEMLIDSYRGSESVKCLVMSFVSYYS